MKSARVPVMVDKESYETVKAYSQLIGIPATRVIAEALADWCNTVGKTRLEVLTGMIVNVVPESPVIDIAPTSDVIEMPQLQRLS